MKELENEAILTPTRFAARLSVSRSQFFKMASSGKLPAPARLSERTVRWSAEEVAKWIAAGCPVRDKWNALKKA
jgi:predicted DNA-binding transcriptional regulator AlpA